MSEIPPEDSSAAIVDEKENGNVSLVDPQGGSIKQANVTQPGINNATIDTAEEQKIINETIDGLATLLKKSASDLYYATGELLLEKLPDIYNKDGSIKKFNPGETRKDLFGKLLDEIDRRSKDETWMPKKTYLYNSINLVIEKKAIGDVGTYKSLNISTKIALLKVKNIEEKKKLIEEVAGKTVPEARLHIAESMPQKDQKQPTLSSYIRKPETIIDVEKITVVVNKEKRDRLVSDAEAKLAKMNEESTAIATKINNLEMLLSKIKASSEPKKGRKKSTEKAVK